MPNLPASSSFTGSAITEAQFKSAVTDLREFLATLLGTAGTQAEALAAIGAILNDTVARTSATSVVTADRGKLFDCDGTWSINLPAAATAGNGFAIALRNTGSGVITLDPDGLELIDGETTITLAAGESGLIVCDGTGWLMVSRVRDWAKSDGTNALCGFYARTTAGSGLTAPKPAVATKAYIVCIGGGGGGSTQFGGGGGGGYCAKYAAVTGDLSVTVGVGGSGANGGASSVSGGGIATLTAAGGVVGSGGGGGGAASGGDVNIAGTAGYKSLKSGFESTTEILVGGAAHGSAANVAAGVQPGAGGGGTDTVSASGAPGAVFIWWYK